MRSLSSDGEVSEGTSFGELSTLVQDLQTKLLCENKLRSIQPSFSSVPSINRASPITSTQRSGKPSLPNPTQDPTNSPSLSLALSDHPSARPCACTGTANVFFAIDMTGSFCSPDFSNPELCENCPAQCVQISFNQNTCCGNFNDVKSFSV